MSQKLRVGFLSPWDLADSSAWSGVLKPMQDSLQELVTLVPLSTAGVRHSKFDRIAARLVGTFTNKKYLWDHSVRASKIRGKFARKLIRDAQVDVVLAVSASIDVASLKNLGSPIVQVSDSTLLLMENFYSEFTSIHPISRFQARRVSRNSVSRTSHFAMPSTWAIDSLVRDYGVSPASCTLIPFGAVISPTHKTQRQESSKLRVILVSSNWERKNGSAAVRVIERIRNEGHQVELTVVGKCPANLPAWVEVRGMLSRQDLASVYESSDVLIELSKANCSSVTLTDAAAFGIPVIATNVGGTESIVVNGETGILINAVDPILIEEEAHAALLKMMEPAARERMSSASANRYRQLLNWKTWSRSINDVLLTSVKNGS